MISLWFLVTRPLDHHTGEASSTIRTTSPSACTDSNTEMHEHKHLMRQPAAEQIDKVDEKKYGLQFSLVCILNAKWQLICGGAFSLPK